MSDKLVSNREPLLRWSPHQTSMTRTRKWSRVIVVCLAAIFALHGWMDICHTSQTDPYSTIPSGGPGVVVVTPCGDRLECGYINVPKDYFDASKGVANVAFSRFKAPNQPSKGSIMLNPGGPGGSGTRQPSAGLSRMLGDDYDLIGFDPRGIGHTRPQTKCFPDSITHQLLYANSVFEQGYTVPNSANLSDPLNKVALTTQARQALAIQEAQARLCQENMDVEDLKYMGTATVVRDMDFMTRTFYGEDSKVNLFTGSYGAVLGSYLVNMIPQRVGSVVIDGIVDPIQWANEPSHRWHKEWTSSAEKTYQWFLRDCSKAGPDLCAIAESTGEAPFAIQERVEAFIQDLVDRPLAGSYHSRPGYITSGAARGALYRALEQPRTQPQVARAFAEAMQDRNATLLLSMIFTPVAGPPGHSGGADLARLAVTCADSPWKPVPTAEDVADELLAGLQMNSPHFGASPIITEPDGGCHFWPTRGRAPERFTGPWNASLEYPMLIISNTADPLTPIASGLLINQHMSNSSTMIIQNGPGHCSTSLNSVCTWKAVRSYFAGHPPKNGTWCEVTEKAFPNTTNSLGDLSAEDQEILQAASIYRETLWRS